MTIPLPEVDEQVVIFMMTVSFVSGSGKSALTIGSRDAQAGTIVAALPIRNGEVVMFEAEVEQADIYGQSNAEVVNWQVKW